MDTTTPRSEADTVAKSAAQPPHKLGVLFVHGIGEQREGDTLTVCSEPLLDWIRTWIRGHGRLAFSEPMPDTHRDQLAQSRLQPDGIEVTDASLFPSRRQSADPPHIRATLRFKDDAAGHTQQIQQWLLAECWWGEQVQAPPVFELLGWMYSRGPWVALAHFAERAWRFAHRRHAGSTIRARLLANMDKLRWRQAVWPFAALAFVFAATLLQFFLFAAAVFALIPIPTVRRYVSLLLQRATSILGDSYGLVANETQRGAILTRFRDTVRWLKPQSEKLIVVAHSQGAAVVGAAIDDGLIDPPDLLITYGAGLVKLLQLRQCEETRRGRLLSAGWIVPTLLAAVVLHVWLAFGAEATHWTLWTTLIALYFIALGCSIAAWTAWRETRVQTRSLKLSPSRPTRWIDLYASSDPVPQDALDRHLPRYGITSERVINRRSFLSDHTSYWQNRPEFVTRVAAELDAEAQLLGVPNLATSKEYRRAVKHHRDAMIVLSLGWWSFIGSLIAWAIFQFDRLAVAGKNILDGLQDTPLQFIATTIAAPGAGIAWAIGKLADVKFSQLQPVGHASVALGAGVLLGYLWWKSVVIVFSKWNSASLSDFLAYKNAQYWGRYGTLLVWPFMDLFALLPVAIAFCLWVEVNPWLFVLQATGLVIASLYSILIGYTLLAGLPKNRQSLIALMNKVYTFIHSATQPGRDDASIRRFGDWGRFFNLCTLTIAALIVLQLIAQALGIVDGTLSDLGVQIGMGVVAIMLTVRLSRLIAQRGYSRWLGLSLAFTLMVVGTAILFTRLDTLNELERIPFVMALMLPLLGLSYFAVDRWLPVKR